MEKPSVSAHALKLHKLQLLTNWLSTKFQKPSWLINNSSMQVVEWVGVNKENRCTRLACGLLIGLGEFQHWQSLNLLKYQC